MYISPLLNFISAPAVFQWFRTMFSFCLWLQNGNKEYVIPSPWNYNETWHNDELKGDDPDIFLFLGFSSWRSLRLPNNGGPAARPFTANNNRFHHQVKNKSIPTPLSMGSSALEPSNTKLNQLNDGEWVVILLQYCDSDTLILLVVTSASID